jgi:hypothetical protein
MGGGGCGVGVESEFKKSPPLHRQAIIKAKLKQDINIAFLFMFSPLGPAHQGFVFSYAGLYGKQPRRA